MTLVDSFAQHLRERLRSGNPELEPACIDALVGLTDLTEVTSCAGTIVRLANDCPVLECYNTECPRATK